MGLISDMLYQPLNVLIYDLNYFQHWVVFDEVTEIVILVPALLGLKGNLEMTLASRLSTQANLGHMDTPKQQWSMIVGNLTLIQVTLCVVLNFTHFSHYLLIMLIIKLMCISHAS